MQFTKVFSILAVAATTVHALPEPIPAPQAGANGTVSVSGVTQALSTVLGGSLHLSAASSAVIYALVEGVLESGEEDASSAASAIATISGQSAVYAGALENLLAAIQVCVNGHT